MSAADVLTMKGEPVKQEEGGGIDIDAILGGAEKPKEAKSGRSKSPVIVVPVTTQKQVSRLRVVADQLDSLQAEHDLLSSEIIDVVTPIRIGICRASGHTTTVRVPDDKGESVAITWVGKYSKIPIGSKSELQEIAGESYPQMFTPAMTIKVKQDITEVQLRGLITAVGAETFAQIFEVERWLYPTKIYTENAPREFDDARLAALKEIVRQYKPSVKVR